jgi:hypothetical protein
MYNCPSSTDDCNIVELNEGSAMIYELLNCGVIVMLLIGMQFEPSIIIGMENPPLGMEYVAYFVCNLHNLLLTTMVKGGTGVYLLLASPVLLYYRVYNPAATPTLAAILIYTF